MKRSLLLCESCEMLERDSCRVVETAPLEVFKSWNTIRFPARGRYDSCKGRAGPQAAGGGFRTSLSGGRQELKGTTGPGRGGQALWRPGQKVRQQELR